MRPRFSRAASALRNACLLLSWVLPLSTVGLAFVTGNVLCILAGAFAGFLFRCGAVLLDLAITDSGLGGLRRTLMRCWHRIRVASLR